MAKTKTSTQDYENLGKMLANIYETGYLDKNKSYKQSFIKGIMGGAGGIIGTTIVLALLLGILSLFKQVPLVGPFVDHFRHTVQERK